MTPHAGLADSSTERDTMKIVRSRARRPASTDARLRATASETSQIRDQKFLTGSVKPCHSFVAVDADSICSGSQGVDAFDSPVDAPREWMLVRRPRRSSRRPAPRNRQLVGVRAQSRPSRQRRYKFRESATCSASRSASMKLSDHQATRTLSHTLAPSWIS